MIPVKEMLVLVCVVIIGAKGIEIADAYWNARKYDAMLMQSLEGRPPLGEVDLLVKSPGHLGGKHSGD